MVDDDNDSTFTFETLSAATERVLKSRELSIQTDRSRPVSGGGLSGAREMSEAIGHTIFADSRAPRPPIPAPRNAFKSRCIPAAFRPISLIETGSSFAQIDDAIISPVTIDVIKPNGRPFAMNEKPSQPMCSIGLAENGDVNISPFEMPCDATSASAARQTNSPAKDSSVGTITENPMSFSGIEHSTPHQKEDEKGKRKRRGDEKREQESKKHDQYVHQRLMDIASFERRARGKGFKR